VKTSTKIKKEGQVLLGLEVEAQIKKIKKKIKNIKNRKKIKKRNVIDHDLILDRTLDHFHQSKKTRKRKIKKVKRKMNPETGIIIIMVLTKLEKKVQ